MRNKRYMRMDRFFFIEFIGVGEFYVFGHADYKNQKYFRRGGREAPKLKSQKCPEFSDIFSSFFSIVFSNFEILNILYNYSTYVTFMIFFRIVEALFIT